MSQKLVSIITPCYNGEKYIHRLLDSILMQTYNNIEMFVIDDGSTDNSAEVIKSYVSKFKKRGYKLTYAYQSNQGQSVAINHALKLVKGDYLVWPDADDFYTSLESISTMAAALDTSGDEVSMVRVQYNVVGEKEEPINQLGVNDITRHKTDLFEDAIFGANGFWYPPGGYMAKISKFDELIPGREIYTEKDAGQNFQLYLPLLYRKKCLTIEEYLYTIVAHDDSHSRNVATNNNRQRVYYRTIKNTLDKLPLDAGYRTYLMRRVRTMTIENSQVNQGQIRLYVKRAVKAVIPYGLMMLYRRRSR